VLDRPTERWLQEPTGANKYFTIQRGYVVCELPSSVRSYHQGDRLRRRPPTAVVDRIERANPPYPCASSPPFVPQLFDRSADHLTTRGSSQDGTITGDAARICPVA
jgi:hypothetical protein